jgi:hypothetical protein
MMQDAFIMSNPTSRTLSATARRARWQRSYYRFGQFYKGLLAGAQKADESAAKAVLTPTELALFRRMPPDARQHSLGVLQTLQAEAPVPHDLAVAALLHDVGKVAADEAGAYLGLWLRGPIVLAEAFAPAWLTRLADARPSSSLRYALYVQIHHPAIGAMWAQQAGCNELTCWLIASHQEKLPTDDQTRRELLARLQAADNMN